jgi:hypothetical protein
MRFFRFRSFHIGRAFAPIWAAFFVFAVVLIAFRSAFIWQLDGLVNREALPINWWYRWHMAEFDVMQIAKDIIIPQVSRNDYNKFATADLIQKRSINIKRRTNEDSGLWRQTASEFAFTDIFPENPIINNLYGPPIYKGMHIEEAGRRVPCILNRPRQYPKGITILFLPIVDKLDSGRANICAIGDTHSSVINKPLFTGENGGSNRGKKGEWNPYGSNPIMPIALLFGGLGFAALGYWQMFSPRHDKFEFWLIGFIGVAAGSYLIVVGGMMFGLPTAEAGQLLANSFGIST